jgi:iron(III) transport system substrate-binding protein
VELRQGGIDVNMKRMIVSRKRMLSSVVRGGVAIACISIAMTSVVAMNGSAGASASKATKKVTETSILAYNKANQLAYLKAGACKEGRLIYYTGWTNYATLATAFEKAYPCIKVQSYFNATEVPTKIETEYAAGKHDFDVLVGVLGQMPITSKYFAKLNKVEPNAKNLRPNTENPYYFATDGYVESIGYNPNLVTKAEVPTTWQDLTNSQYKGELLTPTSDDVATLMGVLGQKFGQSFLTSLAANAVVQNIDTASVWAEVVAGQYPFALDTASPFAYVDSQNGDPFVFVPLDPMTVSWFALSVAKDAPDPYAAALFALWIASRNGGQKVFAASGETSPLASEPLIDVPYLSPTAKYDLVNPSTASNFASVTQPAWEQQFQTIFVNS